MSTIEQVPPGHMFPSGLDWTIAVLSVSLDDIAARFSMEPASFFEDGLGPARGVLIRLPSGSVILIKELAHVPGPYLVVDGGDVVTLGISSLLDEVVSALGLSESAVAWQADENSRQSAAGILAARRPRP